MVMYVNKFLSFCIKRDIHFSIGLSIFRLSIITYVVRDRYVSFFVVVVDICILPRKAIFTFEFLSRIVRRIIRMKLCSFVVPLFYCIDTYFISRYTYVACELSFLKHKFNRAQITLEVSRIQSKQLFLDECHVFHLNNYIHSCTST